MREQNEGSSDVPERNGAQRQEPAGLAPASVRVRRSVVTVRSFAPTGLLVVAAIYSLHFGRDVFMPVAAALVLYLVLTPALRVLLRAHVPGPLAAMVIVIGLFAAMGAGVYAVAAPASDWLGRMPEIVAQVRYKLDAIKKPVEDVRKASEMVEKMTDVSGQQPTPPAVVVKTRSWIELVSSNLVQFAFAFAAVFVLLFFLLASGDLFKLKLIRVAPTFSDKKRAVTIVHQIERDVSAYLATVAVINAGLGAAVGLGMYAIGMPNPLLWGVMAGLLNFVPYLGSLLGKLAVSVVALISFDTLSQALLAPGIYVVCTILEGQFITPAVVGRRLTLNPVVIFLAVIFWGWLWGVPGALLAVPFLVILKSLCEHVDRLQPIAEFLSGAEAPPAVRNPEAIAQSPALTMGEPVPAPVTTPPPGAVSAG